MKRKRRAHSPAFKAKVALASVKGDRTISELAQQFEIHPNQIQSWKKQLLEGAAEVFSNGQAGSGGDTEKIKDLHAKIGELAMEKDFLSKALGRDR